MKTTKHAKTPSQAPSSLVDWLRFTLNTHKLLVERAAKPKPRGTLNQPEDWVLNLMLESMPRTMPINHTTPIDFIVGRQDIETSATGTVVARLMAFTDTQDHCMLAMQRLRLVFDGYSDDPREIHQIPEVKAFIRAVNAQWPYWFHFITPEPDQLAVLILLLCDSGLVQGENLRVQGRITDAQQVWDCLGRMTHSVATLHLAMNLPIEAHHLLSERLLEGIAKIVV